MLKVNQAKQGVEQARGWNLRGDEAASGASVTFTRPCNYGIRTPVAETTTLHLSDTQRRHEHEYFRVMAFTSNVFLFYFVNIDSQTL